MNRQDKVSAVVITLSIIAFLVCAFIFDKDKATKYPIVDCTHLCGPDASVVDFTVGLGGHLESCRCRSNGEK